MARTIPPAQRVARRIYGVRWIVGCPQSGKTTLARWLAGELSRARGVPVLVIDPAKVWNLADQREYEIEEAVGALWKEPRASARIVPRGLADVDRMCRAIRAGKDVVLLVDEAHFWLSAQSGSSPQLVALMRATQHARADLILTTHHLTGDVPQSALSCTTEIYAFRNVAPRVLECLDRSFGLPADRVRALPQFRWMRARLGFET
jgi:hypothetical protein